MNLAIDIGNTNIKYAFFEGSRIVKLGNLVELTHLNGLMAERNYDRCIIGSVRFDEKALRDQIDKDLDFLYFDTSVALPIGVNYDTPETLGTDRLAAVIGGQVQFPNKAIMVIDIGTCITYDLLDADGIYQGGAISPGLDLKYKAVHDYTARLPLVQKNGPSELFGKSTQTSIESGVVNGTWAEVEGMISQFMLKTSSLKVIITGGGVKTFESKIKADIFVALEIVLVGLNRVLEYNAQKF